MANISRYRIGLIAGDGIGTEVMPEALRALDAAGSRFGLEFDYTEFDWSCERFNKTGAMMDDDGIEQVKELDAILLGAVGAPGVPDHVSLWNLLIPLRRELQLYANVRPVRLMPGTASPLAGRGPEDIDMVIVRENNEGEYSSIGGRIYEGTDQEMAMQQSIFTRRGVDRIMKYAFELARTRKRRHVTSATKSNGIVHTMPYWDERFAAMAAQYEDIETAQFHIDILVAHFVRNPDWFDVVVASNLFGDILSDLGPAVAGSIGIAPSGNINPEREFPSLFEPVHGSAPDIAGTGIANPVGMIWSAAMMLDHLGHGDAAKAVEGAIGTVLQDEASRTRDLGGNATTIDCGQAIASAI